MSWSLCVFDPSWLQCPLTVRLRHTSFIDLLEAARLFETSAVEGRDGFHHSPRRGFLKGLDWEVAISV